MKIPLRSYAKLLAKYLKPQRGKVVILAFLLGSTILLQLVNPQIIRYFLDTALEPGGDSQKLTYAAVAFLGLALLIQVLSVIATYVGEDIGWIATNALRRDLALHALRLDMTYHNEHTPGEMIERIDSDIADLAIFFSQFVIRVFANLILLVGVLVMLLREDWRVGAVMAVYIGLSLYLMNKIRDVAQPYWTAAREASADQFGFLEEQLSSVEDIRSSGAVDHVMRGLFKVNTRRLEAERKAGVMNILVILLWIGSYSLAQAMAFISGYYLFRADVITIGTVYLIVYYTDAIYRPLREITNEIQNLQKAGASIERVEQLYAIQPTIQDGKKHIEHPSSQGLKVEFDHVTFGYEDDETILKDLTFCLEPGTVLGLLGRTGSGKTTITRLLFRLFEPRDGTIYLDSTNICDTRQADLRRQIGMVTQNVQLFRATIRDNLTFFDKSISDNRLMEVIEELELRSWYDKLPKGLDTELEAGGGGLSAGEAQLLAFARVFLKDPGLVILDEASSRLDPATEQLIERAIDKLLKNRTAIIVAHRLGTVERADEIMILQDGEILEYDTYDALVLDPTSHFYQLRQTGLKEVLA